jgi:putative cell wall-binding protein
VAPLLVVHLNVMRSTVRWTVPLALGVAIATVITGAPAHAAEPNALRSASAAAETLTPSPRIDRISGADRYATSVQLSQAGYPGTAPVVYVATGTNYPDALAAAPAATKEGGPLLLTPSNALPTVISDELTRLKPSKVVVVGGVSAVSESVVAGIAKSVPNTIRVAGSDRFETGRKVVQSAFPSAGSGYVATGLNFPDALSASAAAGAAGVPVVLVNGNASNVDEATANLIGSLGTTNITIVGGQSAVSADLARGLASLATVTRSSGNDRFATSVAINKQAFQVSSAVYLATGFQFPDALAGAALAGAKGAPLYVAQTECVPEAVLDDIGRLGAASVTLIGGSSALGNAVANLVSCTPHVPNPVTAGAFCAAANAGWIGYTATGIKMVCSLGSDARYRWRAA